MELNAAAAARRLRMEGMRHLTRIIAFGLLSLGAGAAEVIDPKTVTYENLPDDRGVETPWAATPTTAQSDPFAFEEIAGFTRTLATWAPAADKDPDKRVVACLSLAALADYLRTPYEADAPVILFEHLQTHVPEDQLAVALARVALHPDDTPVLTKAAAFALEADPKIDLPELRARASVYARKMLGRLLHKLP